MKALRTIICTLVVALSCSLASAQTPDKDTILDSIVNTLNSPQIKNQILQQGMFNSVNATHDSKDVITNIGIAMKEINFTQFTDELTNTFTNSLSDNFVKSLANDPSVLEVLRNSKIGFKFNFTDPYGNTKSVYIPYTKL